MNLANKDDLFAYIDQHLSADIGKSTFYHYTTTNALLNGMLAKEPRNGKEICLWATHRRYLNDLKELELGIEIASELLYRPLKMSKEEMVSKVRHRVDNTYLTSFSLNPDSLHMWNMYANNGSGIALGFNRIRSLEDDFFCLRCCYTIPELSDLVDDVLDKAPTKFDYSLLCACIPSLMKNNSYHDENEVRLVGDLKEDKDGNYKTQYRAKNGYIIPYKEFYLPKEQLTSITIGPCLDFELTKKSLQMLLDSKGFENIKYIKSRVPYRNNL